MGDGAGDQCSFALNTGAIIQASGEPKRCIDEILGWTYPSLNEKYLGCFSATLAKTEGVHGSKP